ncbi:MAG TPA: hypothetical protein VIO58_13545 [Candidatus Methanoperedens sp.]
MKEEHKRPCGIYELPYERNNYYYGKLMTVRDFFDEQRYFNEKRWLINRMVNGWGVVCGLDVKWKDDNRRNTVVITPGIAIDCCGREIIVQEQTEKELIPEKNKCSNGTPVKEPEELVICLEYHECMAERIEFPLVACDHDEKNKFNRIRDSFKIRVRADVEIKPPYGKYCPLCEEKVHPKVEPYIPKQLHNYLCDKLKRGCPECDKAACVVLATIVKKPMPVAQTASENPDMENIARQVSQSETDKKILPRYEIDQCSKRRLIYSNPLLYDLIYCYHGDLPHIIDINWSDLHGKENVPWDKFAALTGGENSKEEMVEGTGLTVTFDKLMDTTTINKHTFLFGAFLEEEKTGYRIMHYIPPDEIIDKDTGYIKDTGFIFDTIDIQGKKVTKATFKVEGGWRDEEVSGIHSGIHEGFDIEIILRGSSILSMDKMALDGDFIGSKFPTGNGVQGGDFVSWFHVMPK